jgi:hypothetical protein
MIRGYLWVLALLGFLLSCAVSVPPSGGPEDKEPPRIVATTPSNESTGVDVGSTINLSFSEKMMSSKVERLVISYPPIEIGNVKWHKNSLTIEPAKPLHRDTTYLIEIKPGFRDQHNVSNTSGFDFAFATAAHIDSGSISGTVYFRRKVTTRGIVRCFRIPRDSSFYPESARPDREITANQSGEYSFKYLPTSNVNYVIWAFQDQNNNDFFDRSNEYGQAYPDTIVLSPASSIWSTADIYIVDPTEPGEIDGKIVNEAGIDTIPVSVGLYASIDSTSAVSYFTYCDVSSGSFQFKNVRKGTYICKGFIDFKKDSLCGSYRCFADTTRICAEPCVEYPDSIHLDPGQQIKLEPMILKKADENSDDR